MRISDCSSDVALPISYRAFDRVYVLGDEAKAALARRGITDTDTLPLGVDSAVFTPAARDPGYRAALGLGGAGPLLVYAGRIDNEKRADRLIDMFHKQIGRASCRERVVQSG